MTRPTKKGSRSVKNFEELRQVVADLRGRKGCPWDRRQTHQSLKPYLLEETYETLETIDQLGKRDGYGKLREELGDLLLQIMLHAQLAAEKKKFNIYQVIQDIGNKMIRRHPHVFGKKKAKTVEEVWGRWEEIKKQEKENYSILKSIPRELPALSRADKIQRRVARVGFDWGSFIGPLEKLDEEIRELHEILRIPWGKRRKYHKWAFKEKKFSPKEMERLKDEVGDILLSVVNIARRLEVDSEEALRHSTAKFIRRFNFIEKTAKKRKKNIAQMTLAEMDKIWDQAKKKKL